MNFQSNAFALLFMFLLGPRLATLAQAPHSTSRPARPIETTVTALVESPATFNGRHVHVFASFHSDGIHLSVLKEPNCGLFDGTSKNPPPNQPQCAKGIAPAGSTESTDDEGDQALYQALAQGQRVMRDKHITAEFTGIFRCDPCTSRKYFKLEIERTKNISVTMKDVKPHHPAS